MLNNYYCYGSRINHQFFIIIIQTGSPPRPLLHHPVEGMLLLLKLVPLSCSALRVDNDGYSRYRIFL